MKNLKTLVMLFIGLAAMSLASCNSDSNDYRQPTLEEQDAMQTAMLGSYRGTVDFQRQPTPTSTKFESYRKTSATWTVQKGDPTRGEDSLLIVRDFPINQLDSAIYIEKGDVSETAQKMMALRTAISNLPNEDLKCKFFVPWYEESWVMTTGYRFAVNPYVVQKTLEYGGETHKVSFIFIMNNYIGMYTSATRKLSFNMCLGAIVIDKELKDIYLDYVSTYQNYFRPIGIICSME